jgi:CHAT domain-containing protein/tetratricopeptide (TPR) repeat protein
MTTPLSPQAVRTPTGPRNRRAARLLRIAAALSCCVHVAFAAAPQETRRVVDDPKTASARRNLLEALEEEEPNTAPIGAAWYRLADCLRNADRHEESLQAGLRALDVYRKAGSTSLTTLVNAKSLVAGAYYWSDRAEEGFAFATTALMETESQVGPTDPRLAPLRFAAGGNAQKLLQLDDSERLFRAALACDGLPAFVRVRYADALAETLLAVGRPAEAFRHLAEASATLETVRNPPPELRAQHAVIAAFAEAELGRFDAASERLKTALAAWRELPRPPAADIGGTLAHLAQLADARGLLDEAEARFLEAVPLVGGPRGPRTNARLWAAAAGRSAQRGRVAEAESRATVAEKAARELRPPHPPTLGAALLRRAEAAHLAGRPAEAATICVEAEALLPEGALVDDNVRAAATAVRARAVYAVGRRKEAAELLLRALRGARSVRTRYATALSENERLALEHRHRRLFDVFLSAAVEGGLPTFDVADEVSAFKGHVLRAVGAEREKVRGRSDDAAEALRARLVGVERALAAAIRSGTPATDVEALARDRERLERELTLTTAGSAPAYAPPSSRDIAAALAEDEAFVDFILFRPCDPGVPLVRFEPTSAVAAVVHRAARAPIVVRLGSAGEIVRAVDAHQRITEGAVAADPATQAVAASVGAAARAAVWDPLAPALAGARVVRISPDGFLAALSFETLPGAGPGRYLLEDAAISYAVDARDAVAGPTTRPNGAALLVGGPRYRGLIPGATTRPTAPELEPLSAWEGELSAVGASLAELEGASGPAVLLTGEAATEAAVRAAVAGKSVVHLATHGVFPRREAATTSFRTPADAASAAKPAQLSGVALAGACDDAPSGADDGVLTAAEAAWLDLDGCGLVTLSSCDSGRGVPQDGEGVIGLRRSLRLAGARSTLTALWRVDDAATAALMADFYGRWVAGTPKADALRAAKLAALVAARRTHAGAGCPGLWGAFVLEGR